jgi:hydroxymethylbilane synthase
MSNKIVVGTRGSILALAQAEKVKQLIEDKYLELKKNGDTRLSKIFGGVENLDVELKIIVTKGDKDLRDFQKIQGTSQKDLFVKEIEREMLENKIDLAVHSLKDMPQVTPNGLLNASFPIREDNRDVLVSRNGKKLEELPENAIVGTGSTRREKEILNLRSDVQIKSIRGNIHTRLKKLDDGEYDAIVLAAAGLKRVGLEDRITQYFRENEFIPAPGQGILCIQCRENDNKIRTLLEEINDDEVKLMCQAEREFSRIFDGGCHTPIGCSSKIDGENLTLKGMFYESDTRILEEIMGKKYDAEKLAQELAEKIKRVVKMDKNKVKGKVYIAGAGCGDEQLITLKLKNILEKADCVIYDRLVNPNILQYSKPGAELIYMGKENTEGGELQLKINQTIVEKAFENAIVLRLKGGDPFVFGRGGEEIEALLAENIEFEVIPGITSSIAVPAYAGIPVTHRGINTSFHVFTGHTKIDGSEHDFSTIAKLDGTLIFLMGLGNLEKIVENLVENGKKLDTPVAIIKDGTTSKQKTYTGTLGTIVEIVKGNNVKSPVIIIIGEVVNLREKMQWFEKKVLSGKNILVTRNKEKQKKVADKINELGGQAVSLPLINIEYNEFEMPDLSQYGAILFNSANSVIGFMNKIKDMRQLANVKIGVVGTKTAEEMENYKIIPDFYPKEYTVERLAAESVKFTNPNERVLFVVSNISPVDTEKYDKLYGRKYEKVVVYSTEQVKIEEEKVEREVRKSDILMFLSSSTFESFVKNLGIDDLNKTEKLKNILDGKVIASIGPVTTKTIEKYGIKVNIEAEKYTEDGLLNAIEKYYKN